MIPGDNHPYTLVLPSQQIYSFIMSEDSIDNYRDDLYAHREVVEPGGQTMTADEYINGEGHTDQTRTIIHKVERGETLSSIASKYGMTPGELMSLNNMSSERVRRGDNLKVRAYSNVASADNEDLQPTEQSQNSQADEELAMSDAAREQAQFDEVKDIERKAAEKSPYKGSYTVNVDNMDSQKSKKAETHSDDQTTRQRASKTNTSSWRSRNAKYSEKDSRGAKNSKGKESTRSSKSSKKQHKPKQPSEVTVQKGESLTKIAEKAGVSVNDLKRANNIDDGNKIKAGEKIKIPTKEETRQAANDKKGSKSSKSSKSSGSSKAGKSSSKSGSSKSSGKSSGKSSNGKKSKKK